MLPTGGLLFKETRSAMPMLLLNTATCALIVAPDTSANSVGQVGMTLRSGSCAVRLSPIAPAEMRTVHPGEVPAPRLLASN